MDTFITQNNKKPCVTHKRLLQGIISSLVLGSSLSANAIPAIHAVDINQVQVDGGQGVGMSRSGRYILYSDQARLMKVLDLKTQFASPLSVESCCLAYAISPNGRYVTYPTPASFSTLEGNAIDRVTSANFKTPNHDEHIAISDNGFSATRDQKGNGGLILLNLKDQTRIPIDNFRSNNSTQDRHDWFSADGKVILFRSSDATNNTSGFQIYNAAVAGNNKILPFNPIRSNGVTPIVLEQSCCMNGESTVALSSNGKFVAFTAFSGPTEQNIWVSTLSLTGNHTQQEYNLINLNVNVENGLSISSNGRFISFRGQLRPNHPEYAAAQALGHTSFYRIFRYDTLLNQVVTVSVAKDGGPLRKFDPSQPSLTAKVYSATVISDDGSTIEFNSDADNILSTTMSSNQGMKKYYAYLGNGFTRNYQFVDMPNSDTQLLPFAPMTLVGNNQWEGTLTFDGVDAEYFRFDVGGNLAGSTPVATSNNSIKFGPSATPGQAVAGTSTIPVTGGAGTYKVTFNDQTLQYSVTQLTSTGDWKRTVIFMYGETQTGQDMFIRGGLDHAKAKTVLGRDCDLNPALCSMPIRHLNTLNPTTAPWKIGDSKLDWQGIEAGQGANAQGSPLDWTTNLWPSSWGAKKTVALNGYGETPVNVWGQHYWMLEVEMDCSKTYNGWFEIKSFISNGPGWEGNIAQANTPWASNNHFAQCGKMNVFKRGQSTPVVVGGTL